jgi:HD-GYP domain-containing protein (c-di-GMP phosphodiesterase class II)
MPEEALADIERGAGTQFDPQAVAAFLQSHSANAAGA